MGVNSPHYVDNTWPSNEGSYNWDAGLLCSWNAGLSPTFSCWGNVGRGSWASRLGAAVVLKWELQTLCRASRLRRGSWASRLGTMVVLKCELQTLCRASVWDSGFKLCVLVLKWCWDVALSSASWHYCGVEMRASSPASWLYTSGFD